jgi:hypothetical protein
MRDVTNFCYRALGVCMLMAMGVGYGLILCAWLTE